MESLLIDLNQAEARMIELKDQAMFWIHLVEWLVITATVMISGLATWTLMVRRRLYREVQTLRYD